MCVGKSEYTMQWVTWKTMKDAVINCTPRCPRRWAVQHLHILTLLSMLRWSRVERGGHWDINQSCIVRAWRSLFSASFGSQAFTYSIKNIWRAQNQVVYSINFYTKTQIVNCKHHMSTILRAYTWLLCFQGLSRKASKTWWDHIVIHACTWFLLCWTRCY